MCLDLLPKGHLWVLRERAPTDSQIACDDHITRKLVLAELVETIPL